MNSDNIAALITAIIVTTIIGFGMWLHFFAPCGWHKFSPAAEIPARCLSGYTR